MLQCRYSHKYGCLKFPWKFLKKALQRNIRLFEVFFQEETISDAVLMLLLLILNGMLSVRGWKEQLIVHNIKTEVRDTRKLKTLTSLYLKDLIPLAILANKMKLQKLNRQPKAKHSHTKKKGKKKIRHSLWKEHVKSNRI